MSQVHYSTAFSDLLLRASAHTPIRQALFQLQDVAEFDTNSHLKMFGSRLTADEKQILVQVAKIKPTNMKQFVVELKKLLTPLV